MIKNQADSRAIALVIRLFFKSSIGRIDGLVNMNENFLIYSQ